MFKKHGLSAGSGSGSDVSPSAAAAGQGGRASNGGASPDPSFPRKSEPSTAPSAAAARQSVSLRGSADRGVQDAEKEIEALPRADADGDGDNGDGSGSDDEDEDEDHDDEASSKSWFSPQNLGIAAAGIACVGAIVLGAFLM